METILAHAHNLVYTLLALMPSNYQRDSLEGMLGLFLEAQGNPLPHYSQTKSESALSRFLNHYSWPTRSLIRQVRQTALEQIKSHCFKGKKPILQVIVDLTTLEKRGKFKAFNDLINVYSGKRGLHIVCLYLVIGKWRILWNFRPWRGKGTKTPAQLALSMIRKLPKDLTRQFDLRILADAGFGSCEFINTIHKLKYDGLIGISANRKLISCT